MKKLFLIAAITTSLTLFEGGCKSPPQVVAYKAEGTVIYSVDAAMSSWADYVNSGHQVSLKQVETVKVAYQKYYDAQMIAKAALEAYMANNATDKQAAWNIANQSAIDATANVINLVKGYLK